MIAARAIILTGHSVLIASLMIATTMAQEPTPATSTPEQTLKNNHLKRSGTTWILAEDETRVLKDLRDARSLYQQVAEGVMRQRDHELGSQDRKGRLQELRDRGDYLGQQITQLDQQLEALGVSVGNVFVEQQRTELQRQRQPLVAENNRIVNQLNSMQEQGRDQDQDHRLQLNAEVAESREKYMGAILDLRKSVDLVTAKYDALAKNPEISKALEAISVSSKSKQRLGPSKALKDAITQLEKAEGSVQSDSIDLHRDGGVFHVYATLGKVPTKLVFDTGAALTTISADLARKIGVKSRPGDPTIKLKTADNTVVESKRAMIPSVRVGKFTIRNVECAVMPADKGNVDPLLGQSFFKHFKVEFNPDAGRLTLKRLETAEGEGDPKALAEASGDGENSVPATVKAKPRRSARLPKATTKTKRSAKSGRLSPTDASDQPTTDGGESKPN
jgi:clan AA aspartic protease (TIGR02281 family)